MALELFPNQGVLYLMNGIAHNSLKNYNEAISILNEGELFTRTDTYVNVQLLSILADAHNNLEQYSESDEAFEKALKKDPNNPLILNNYSYFLSLRSENLDRAEEMSKKSIYFNQDRRLTKTLMLGFYTNNPSMKMPLSGF